MKIDFHKIQRELDTWAGAYPLPHDQGYNAWSRAYESKNNIWKGKILSRLERIMEILGR